MSTKLNPLFAKSDSQIKVVASASPIDGIEMKQFKIFATDGREIPVEVDFENRVCLPIEVEK